MSRWFRFYGEALNDPKVQGLPGDLFKTWVNLLCVASQRNGQLPPSSELAMLLRRRSDYLQRDLDELVNRDLLDFVDGGFMPHNWLTRQYKSDSSAERTKAWRDRNRDVTKTVTVTPPDNRVQNTDTEKKEDTSLRSARDHEVSRETINWPKDYEAQFWQAYPRKVGKIAAMKALERAHKAGVGFDVILAGIKRIPTRELQFVPHPATWLNRGGWDDEEIPGGSNGSRGPRALQDDRLSLTKAADRLIEQAERGQFQFGPRPQLRTEGGEGDIRLLPKG